MSKLKVLICGGGIAGNVLAFWLSKTNHSVTVIERFPTLRTTGLQIDLRGHAIEVLRRMGLEKSFRDRSVKEQGLQIVNSSGVVRAYFPANRTGEGLQSFTTDYEIMRGDFCRLLHGATNGRVTYKFGAHVKSFEENERGIEVVFSDGTSDQFDLLVGADGQGSRTRNIMLGPEAADPIDPLNYCVGYFTMPKQIQDGEEYNGEIHIATGKRLIFKRRHIASRIQVYLSCKPNEQLKNARRGDVTEERRAFTGIFEGVGWQTSDFLRGLEDADDFYCERLGVVRLDTWSNGRVVLVGDAAYCPSAATGMGTSSAVVGAYILAGEINNHCNRPASREDLLTALKEYETKFRPFMAQVQHGISEDTTLFRVIPTSSWGIAIFNFLLGLVAFLRLDVLSKYILREDVGEWTLPDYRKME